MNCENGRIRMLPVVLLEQPDEGRNRLATGSLAIHKHRQRHEGLAAHGSIAVLDQFNELRNHATVAQGGQDEILRRIADPAVSAFFDSL